MAHGVGPACKRGDAMSLSTAESLKSRRSHCPKCGRTTTQSAEVHTFVVGPCWAYRCDDCACIVESGTITRPQRSPRNEDAPAKPVRKPRED